MRPAKLSIPGPRCRLCSHVSSCISVEGIADFPEQSLHSPPLDAYVFCVFCRISPHASTVLAIDKHVKPFGKEDRRWSDQKLTKSACASRWLMCRLVPWFVVSARAQIAPGCPLTSTLQSALVVIGYGISIGEFGFVPGGLTLTGAPLVMCYET